MNILKGGLCLLSGVFSSSDILTVTVSEHLSELYEGKGGKVGRVRGGRRGRGEGGFYSLSAFSVITS